MKTSTTSRYAALTTLVAAQLWLGASARAEDFPVFTSDTAGEARLSGVRVQLDNDLFAGGERDRDYTGGLSVTISGTTARDGLLSLDPLLKRLDGAARVPEAATYHARQFGLMAFTPQDIVNREPQHDDRPYASLLFVSNSRTYVDEDARTAWSTNLTIGVLGLSLSESVHDAVHQLVGSESPQGYDHQISAGGEPTARYSVARQQLWIADPTGHLDVKTTLQASVGYLTETSAAVTARIGRFNTPWWSFAPELTDYMASPVPVARNSGRDAMYFFAGVRVKARAYNAFLQGQFRDSDVTYSFADIEPIVAEAWVGFVTQVLENTELSYS
ncbi:MAG TPA: lipid A deacylase LpxR family protein, partial [Steroidobacter sp.]